MEPKPTVSGVHLAMCLCLIGINEHSGVHMNVLIGSPTDSFAEAAEPRRNAKAYPCDVEMQYYFARLQLARVVIKGWYEPADDFARQQSLTLPWRTTSPLIQARALLQHRINVVVQPALRKLALVMGVGHLSTLVYWNLKTQASLHLKTKHAPRKLDHKTVNLICELTPANPAECPMSGLIAHHLLDKCAGKAMNEECSSVR